MVRRTRLNKGGRVTASCVQKTTGGTIQRPEKLAPHRRRRHATANRADPDANPQNRIALSVQQTRLTSPHSSLVTSLGWPSAAGRDRARRGSAGYGPAGGGRPPSLAGRE